MSLQRRLPPCPFVVSRGSNVLTLVILHKLWETLVDELAAKRELDTRSTYEIFHKGYGWYARREANLR